MDGVRCACGRGAKLTIYVVDWTPDMMPLLGEGVGRAAARLGVDPVK